MKQLVFFLIGILLFSACDDLDRAEEREIKTINGYRIVGYYEMEGNDSVKIGERTFYPNSENVYLEFRIKDGKRNGECFSFFKNGQKQSLNTYENGLLNGEYKIWYQNGKLRVDGEYLNDKEVGSWTFFDSLGTVIKSQEYK
jgi:antitoxin component YwqK of YwqJK toxin-antitoxin module